MKKPIFFCLLFIFMKSSATTFYYGVDRTPEVRMIIAKEAYNDGYDSAIAVKAFDILISAFGITAIYLDSTKTGMNHYLFFEHALLIDTVSKKTSVFQKIKAELTHAVQFGRWPIHYAKRALLSFGRTFLVAVIDGNDKRYKRRLDSIRNVSGCSWIRASFMAVYLTDEYDSTAVYDHRGGIEKEHPYIEEEIMRFYEDIIFILPHLKPKHVKKWIKMRKRILYQNLRHSRGFLIFRFSLYNSDMKKIRIGKSFADCVRDIVRKIPKGKTLTYSQVAALAGSYGAARAVGTVMANNYDRTVPCHRVIKSDGTLGGYNRGGIVKKRKLLMSEGVSLLN